MAIPDWVKLLGGIVGLATTLVGLTVYLTRLKLEGSERMRSCAAELAEKRSTVAALEASVQALSQSVSLLRRGKEEAASTLAALEAAITDVRELLGATADSLLVPNPFAPDRLVFLTAHGEAADRIRRLQVPVHESVAGAVLRSGQPRAYLAAAEPAQKFEGADAKSGFDSRAILCVPVRAAGEVVGVAQFLNRRDGSAFTRADIERAATLCQDLAPRVRALVADPETLRLLGVAPAADEAEGSFAFLDITASSTLFSLLPTDEAIGLLNEYFERVGGIALRHGATIDKFVGDGMLLRFNVPCALPGYAGAAVEAAAVIQAEFGRIRDEWLRMGHPADRLAHRIGIATGSVVGGMIGHPQYLTYTVMGAPVNLAAHLCDEARHTRSGILVCPTTWERARGQATARALAAVASPGGTAYELPLSA